MAEPLKYWTSLTTLLEWAGHPEAAAVRAEMRRDLPPGKEPPPDSTVAGWLSWTGSSSTVPRCRRTSRCP
ncbi:hypothetical protein [Streptomyces sp. TRM68367]|uniref:hypothetical protein n=1 Tax=Streptomyces sp. TRM68367 TaxID=2758415 RepID=UPI00165B6DF4|nr:hypothetical protein [Streptomyces sp. TRM68367]MBC9728518.1 hypothetical protein [Streptomyces sp. TRM68367]